MIISDVSSAMTVPGSLGNWGIGLRWLVWGILFLFSSHAHALVCQSVFSNISIVTVSEQVKLVKSFESKSRKKDSKTFVTKYPTLEKILLNYKTTIGQVRTGMGGYTQSKRNLDVAFEMYLKARITMLSDIQRKALEKIFMSVNWVNSPILGKEDDADDLTAAYLPKDQIIYFEMPNQYKGTLLHAYLFAHEMEHAIQHIRLSTAFDNHDVKISDRASNELKYIGEMGAMTAEWTFLQGISDHEIAAAIKQVKKARDIEPTYKTFFLRTLSNARLSINEYITQEHQAGRYSHEFFQP